MRQVLPKPKQQTWEDRPLLIERLLALIEQISS